MKIIVKLMVFFFFYRTFQSTLVGWSQTVLDVITKIDTPGNSCLLGCDAVPFGPESSTNRFGNPKACTDVPVTTEFCASFYILRQSVSRLVLVEYGSVQTDREIPACQRVGE
jgi:hypothetical protein